jgi:hypothetical protein
MNKQNRKRGRPSKNGITKPWYLGRALKIINIYTELRTKAEKHSAAVSGTVESLLQLDPDMHVSESVVKRVLSEFQPPNSLTVFLVDYSILEGPEAAAVRSRFASPPLEPREESVVDDPALSRPLKRFTISIGKRPKYLRHNAQT